MIASLTAFESALMAALLEGDLPFLETLRGQYRAAEPLRREFSGVGFFLYFAVPLEAQRASPPNFEVGDVYFELSGVPDGGDAILFVRDGAIDFLEAVTHHGDWPTDTENFAIHYFDGARNLDLLREQLQLRLARAQNRPAPSG